MDIEVYCDVVRGYAASDIERAFDACSRELSFLPKPKELLDRLPERTQNRPIGQQYWGRVIKEWTEPYGPEHIVRYFLTDEGAKLARIERI